MPAETRTCPVCWTQFTVDPRGGRRIYCSKKCCGTAWERRGRRQARPTTPANGASPSPAPQPVATTGCPHCGKPITIVALLATPQAARPRQPDTTPLRQIQPI
jgi:hypothetical protein